MWTTKEWNACLTRTAAYEYRERKRSGRSGTRQNKLHKPNDSDAKNTGLEQWVKVRLVIEERTRTIWFLSNLK